MENPSVENHFLALSKASLAISHMSDMLQDSASFVINDMLPSYNFNQNTIAFVERLTGYKRGISGGESVEVLSDWINTWSNSLVFGYGVPLEVRSGWATVGRCLIEHKKAAAKAKEKIEDLERDKIDLVNTNLHLKNSKQKLNEDNDLLIKEKADLEAKNNSLKSQLGFQAHKLEDQYADADVPSIVDKAIKACGGDTNKVIGYLAAEVSRLRSVTSKLRTKVTELEAEE